MPVYSVLSQSKLTQPVKEATVKAFTDIHCGETGAPTEFVSVIFMTGYRLKGGYKAVILGNVRKGGNRNEATLKDLQNKIHQGVSKALQYPSDKVNIEFSGFEPSWGWEGGEVLPYPGEETSWLARKNKQHV